MGLPNEVNSALIGAAAAGGYEIEQSLRFDGSSSLSKTFSSAGNSRTWTVSAWVKYAVPGGEGVAWMAGPGQYEKVAFKTSTPHALTLSNYAGSYGYNLITTREFRDPSAWMHLVVVSDTNNATASERKRLYINGVRESAFSTQTNPASGFEGFWNSATAHRIGTDTNPFYFNGYMAEFHSVDGTALDPDNFGEYDDNGVWRPIAYSGSYGSNGFYLKFDETATNGIGHDHSGNGNNFTASGFTTSGTGTDVMDDTPTTNWCTMSPLGGKRDTSYSNVWSLSDGNLVWAASASSGNPNSSVIGTVGVSSGKWYFEVTRGAGDSMGIGWATHAPVSAVAPNSYILVNTKYSSIATFGDFSKSFSNPTLAPSSGDVIGIGLDIDNGTLSVWINGTIKLDAGAISGLSAGSHQLFPFVGKEGSEETGNGTFNFGQRAFEQTVPSGYKALNTSNLPAPDIADGSDYFETSLDTGANILSTTQGVFASGLWWIKDRANTNQHQIFDTVSTSSSVLKCPANGRASYSAPSGNSVGWAWAAPSSGTSNTSGSITTTTRVSSNAGFSLITYTGTGGAATVGHGLGIAPEVVWCTSSDTTSAQMMIGSDYLPSWSNFLELNSDYSYSTSSTRWNDTAPTATVVSVGNACNYSGQTMYMYAWRSVPGYSKFTSYTGNGDPDGPFVYCGFKPRWIMTKAYTRSGAAWVIWDTERDPYNFAEHNLEADSASAEILFYDIDILSNGFKIRRLFSVQNQPGESYIVFAFAENPFGGSGVSPVTAR